MKSRTISLTFILCFVINSNCISQNNNYVAGYFLNQKGDTIKGYFLAEKNNQLADLKFKKNIKESSFLNISFDTCQAVSFEGFSYLNWYGKRSMTYISNSDLMIVNQDSIKTEMIPLKLIYNGKHLSLYYYSDVTDHFFMGVDGVIEELAIYYRYSTDWEKRRYTINPPTYFISPNYRYQILKAIANTLSKKKKYLIENCKFNIVDLKNLFKKIDD